MILVPFCFRADWAVMAVLKFFTISLQYPTFEVGFFIHILWVKIRVSVHCRVLTKMLINIKVRILSILAINVLGQNKLKAHETYCLCQSVRSVLIVLGIYNFEGKKHKI